MRNLVIAASAALFLAGCNPTLTKTLDVSLGNVAEQKAAPLSLENYEFKTLNADEIVKLADAIKRGENKDTVLFVLTPEGFKKFESNNIEIERYILEQKNIIVYYKQIIQDRSVTTPQKKK